MCKLPQRRQSASVQKQQQQLPPLLLKRKDSVLLQRQRQQRKRSANTCKRKQSAGMQKQQQQQLLPLPLLPRPSDDLMLRRQRQQLKQNASLTPVFSCRSWDRFSTDLKKLRHCPDGTKVKRMLRLVSAHIGACFWRQTFSRCHVVVRRAGLMALAYLHFTTSL
jgi:hypothetical protein